MADDFFRLQNYSLKSLAHEGIELNLSEIENSFESLNLKSIAQHLVTHTPENVYFIKDSTSVVAILPPFVWLTGEVSPDLLPHILKTSNRALHFIPSSPWQEYFTNETNQKNFRIKAHHRYSFNHHKVEEQNLSEILRALPDNYELKPLSGAEVDFLLQNPSHFQSQFHIVSYGSKESFLDKGFGIGLHHGSNLVGAASSAATGNNSIEIQVDIIEAYRNKGLSKYVSAALIKESLNRGIEPMWDAASEISKNLALSLGYELTGTYQVFELTEP